ncbi:hypothetical protein AAFF_G00190950 [Aldrovandia affinis]|uniref:Uncharacterized protein n=1 Tax=Aldrovandia affinis TaxID=143900 RepID=A0AAD7RJB3_9TELE|nr:hypothetical protein AAFF_G00190950 [Aldrovandia affinis]
MSEPPLSLSEEESGLLSAVETGTGLAGGQFRCAGPVVLISHRLAQNRGELDPAVGLQNILLHGSRTSSNVGGDGRVGRRRFFP